MDTDTLDLSPPVVIAISPEASPISALITLDPSENYEFSVVKPCSNNLYYIPERRYLCRDDSGALLYQLTENKKNKRNKQTLIIFDSELPGGNRCKIYKNGLLDSSGPRSTGKITAFGTEPRKRCGVWREKSEEGTLHGHYDEKCKRQGPWVETISPGGNAMVQKNVWNYDQGKMVSQIGFKDGVYKPTIERQMNGSLNNMVYIGRMFDEKGDLQLEERSVCGARDGVSLHPKNYTSKIVKDYYRKGKEIPQAVYWWQENKHLLGELKIGTFVKNIFQYKNENKSLFTELEISRARKLDYTRGGI